MKKIGIIKAISTKPENRNAFTLRDHKVDGKDIWFNGYSLDAEKGDEVEFELEINEGFNNFSKLKVLRKAEEIPSPPAPPSPLTQSARVSEESEIAIRLTIAIIAQKHENLVSIEGAVGMYTSALSKLNKSNGNNYLMEIKHAISNECCDCQNGFIETKDGGKYDRP